MKKEYVRPMMVGEEFVANEYCTSTCGKTPTGEYIFKCDAPGGDMYYYPNGRENGTKKYLGNYTPCGKTHTGSNPDYYYDGFIDYNGNRTEDDGEGKLVWVEFGYDFIFGKYEDDGHASASLTMDTINVVRS